MIKPNENNAVQQDKNDKFNADNDTMQQMKDKASEFYDEGKKAVCNAHKNIQEHIDNVGTYAKSNPLSSLLIAGGVGFVLSFLLNR